MKNKTKSDIVNEIYSSTGTSKIFINDLIDHLIKIFITTLKDKKKINIKNFGSFNIKFKSSRIGRNPKNLKTYKISERNFITFKTSKNLKKLINE